MNRTLFIGDVHGCIEELKELLVKVSYDNTTDRLIYLGDILNKGPKSADVLRFIRKQNVECILGNNEVGFLEIVRNGGYEDSSIYDVISDLGGELDDYCQWIEKFPTYIEEDDFIAVHAGIDPTKSVSESSVRIRTTIRTWDGEGKNLNNQNDPKWYELYTGEKVIVYGHYAAQKLQVRDKTIGLDSGCVFGGELTCLIWPSREIVQVKAKKKYLQIS
jgi:predicted phosphodiesterase